MPSSAGKKQAQPPQEQDRQPGIESEMTPRPKAEDEMTGQVPHPNGGTVVNG